MTSAERRWIGKCNREAINETGFQLFTSKQVLCAHFFIRWKTPYCAIWFVVVVLFFCVNITMVICLLNSFHRGCCLLLLQTMNQAAMNKKKETKQNRGCKSSFICHANLISAVNHCCNSNERIECKRQPKKRKRENGRKFEGENNWIRLLWRVFDECIRSLREIERM